MRHISIAAGALLVAGAAFAQDINTGHLAILDTNGDGAVDRAEYAAFVAKAFAALDKNGDGYVTLVEAQGVLTPEQFAAANANGDGGVSRQEFEATTQADFAQMDLDGDGALN
jgi:hypothetical protein